jgi:hypothetical protein
MARRYDSFVLRCWRRDGERRVEVEHLQSGGRIRAATLAAAVGWIGARCGDPDDRGATPRPIGAREEVRTGEEQPGDGG